MQMHRSFVRKERSLRMTVVGAESISDDRRDYAANPNTASVRLC
jgi:hypothetical protein